MPADQSETELTKEDVRFLRRLREQAPDRRDVLAGIAGAAGGAGLALGATGSASAAASTSDSDGDIGTPSNPVDVFADGVDAASVDTDNTITETISYNRERNNPAPTRQPEAGTVMSVRPHPQVSNPVLTGSDVTDVTVDGGVADPFLVFDSGTYHMIFEVLNAAGDAKIAHATSDTGLNWTYDQAILTDKGHSYPFTFKWRGEWYMTPTGPTGGDVDIYRADTFPTDWSLAETPISPSYFAIDPVPIHWDGRWYIFVGDKDNDNNRLFVADSDGEGLEKRSWSEHPGSPYNSSTFRNAGRPVVRNNYIDLVRRDSGTKVHYLRVTNLTPSSLTASRVAENPPVATGVTTPGIWNGQAMHHLDMMVPKNGDSPLIAVDGQSGGVWSIGIYTLAEMPPNAVYGYATTDVSIPSGAFTTVPIDAARYDIAQSFDGANNQWVVPQTGYYDIDISANVDPGSEDNYRITVRARDVTASRGLAFGRSFDPPGNESFTVESSGQAHIPKGNKVELQVYQNSGANQTVTGFEPATFLSAKRIW